MMSALYDVLFVGVSAATWVAVYTLAQDRKSRLEKHEIKGIIRGLRIAERFVDSPQAKQLIDHEVARRVAHFKETGLANFTGE